MKAEEIMHVLRLTAMGRINHPDQQRFCEALEKVLAAPKTVAEVAETSIAVAETKKRQPRVKAA